MIVRLGWMLPSSVSWTEVCSDGEPEVPVNVTVAGPPSLADCGANRAVRMLKAPGSSVIGSGGLML